MHGLRDCVYGEAVADALGVPFEGMRRGSYVCTGMTGSGTHGMPAGVFSDDTSMTLALCDSIRELGRVDVADIRARFVAWLERGEYTSFGAFSAGRTTRRSLESGEGLSGERDNGNGSLMRTFPLAFAEATDDEVRAVSAITHANPVSTGACVGAVHLARELAEGAEPSEAVERAGFSGLSEAKSYEISSGGYVLDTFKAACWCLVTTGSYASCVLTAVNLGGDTDTTAAVAGALAGTVYGKDAIPSQWMETLRGTEIIERCLF